MYCLRGKAVRLRHSFWRLFSAAFWKKHNSYSGFHDSLPAWVCKTRGRTWKPSMLRFSLWSTSKSLDRISIEAMQRTPEKSTGVVELSKKAILLYLRRTLMLIRRYMIQAVIVLRVQLVATWLNYFFSIISASESNRLNNLWRVSMWILRRTGCLKII